MTSVFLSHSKQDTIAAESLKEWLQERGHSVFLDFDPESGIKGGADWEQTLYERLRVCRVLIPLLTPNWLASKWCFAEVIHARSNGRLVVPLKVAHCDASHVFRDVQQIDLVRDPEDGYRRLEIALQEVFPWHRKRPLYPGLLAFQEEDAAIFFGRTPEIAKCIETLESLRRRGRAAPHFALILGASGSGKSSLVRAGILPRLRARGGWLLVPPVRPGKDPIGELCAALAQAYEELQRPRDQTEIRELIETALAGEPPNGGVVVDLARDLVIKSQGGDETVLIVVDQAEELFVESGAYQADRFLRLLRASLEQADGRLMAVATMRSELLGAFQNHPFLLEPAYREPFDYEEITVDHMPVDRFGEIIRRPAELAGISIADDLVERMTADTGTRDALPLLAYTLRRLWDSETYRADGHFDLSEYAALGGLEGSIRRAADEALGAQQLQPKQLDVLRAAFVPALVRVRADGARVRRRAYRDELPRGAVKPIQRFVDARLLITDRDREGRETIELAHEALLRVWPQLDAWLEQDQDKLRLFEGVLSAAEEWQRGERGADLLVHRGERLAEARTLAREPRFAPRPETAASEYLSACDETQRAREGAEREEHERRVRDAERIAASQRKVVRRTFAGLLAALVLAVVGGLAGWVAWNKAHEAEMQRVSAERARMQSEEARILAEKQARVAMARQLALQAQAVVDWYPQRALLLAVESVRRPLELDGLRLPGPDSALRDLLSKVGGAPVMSPLEQDRFNYLDHGGDKDYRRNLLLDAEGRWLAARAKDGKTYDVFSLTDTVVPPLHIRVPSHVNAHPVFDPQARWFAIDSADGSVRLWDLPTGKIDENKGESETHIELATSKARISDLAFDRKGRYFAAATYDFEAGNYDGHILLWDTRDLQRSPRKLSAWKQYVGKLAFDPKGRWLAAVSEGYVNVWDLTDLAAAPLVLPGRRLSDHTQFLAFGPKGRWLAGADAGRAALLWDLTTPSAEPVTIKLDVTQYVQRIAFDPMGRWMAMFTGYRMRLVNLSDPTAPLVVPKTAEGRSYQTKMLAVDPRGRWLAISDKERPATSGRAEGHVRLWDLKNPTLPPKILRGHEQRVLAAAFNTDGRWLTTVGADRVVRRWDLTQTGAAPLVLHGHEGGILSIAFDPTGRWLASVNLQGEVQLSDLTKPANLPRRWNRLGERGNAGVSFDPLGRWLVSAYGDANRLPVTVEVMRLWDLRDPEALRIPMIALAGKNQEAVNISRYGFDPLGRWLVAGIEKSNLILLWNLKKPESPPLTLQGHEARVSALAFDPAGRWLATGDDDGNTRLWDLQNPSAAPRVLQGPGAGVHQITMALRGSVRHIGIDSAGNWIRVIYSSGAKKILEWDLVDFVAPPRTPKPYGQLAQTEDIIAFDSRWRWMVTRDSKFAYRLRETALPDGPARFLRGPGRFNTFRFDPQGRWLATGGIDGSVRLWSLTDSRSDQVVLRGHDRPIKALEFDAAGRWLATGGWDGTVRVWDLRIEKLLDLACQIAGRNLSAEEWDQYLGSLEYRVTCPDEFEDGEAESGQRRAG